MREAYIVSMARTPIGRAKKGTLRNVRPEDLVVTALEGVMKRAPEGLKKEDVEDVIMGCAFPEGPQGMNIARVAALKAGFPVTTTGMTINRFCSSGLQSIALGVMAVRMGWMDVVIAGGVESMSSVPMGGTVPSMDPDLAINYPEAYTSMGITAENVAERFGITREEQDQFGYESNMKACKAIKEGKFDEQIEPVLVKNWEGEDFYFKMDEGPRCNTTLESMAKLKPVFKIGGTVTAGNSSQINDGAAAVLIMSEDAVKRFNAEPFLRLVNYQVAGVPPEIMGVGPAYAVPKLFEKTGFKDHQIALYELNEAFASQSIYCIRELEKKVELDKSKVNVNGGAIALGHPLGCTGAKLTVQIGYELKLRKEKYGVVTMCIGGGMGAAGLFENLRV